MTTTSNNLVTVEEYAKLSNSSYDSNKDMKLVSREENKDDFSHVKIREGYYWDVLYMDRGWDGMQAVAYGIDTNRDGKYDKAGRVDFSLPILIQ